MLLTEATSPDLISIKEPLRTKQEVIDFMVAKLAKEGKIHSENDFKQAILEREALSATGFEGGLAIPHGKSTAVKEAAFAVVTLAEPLSDWESIDPNNKVELVFMLAIPETEGGSTHLKLLSELTTRLTDESYKNSLLDASSANALYTALDPEKESATAEDFPDDTPLRNETILAVTGCAAGIAHTYMAAEALTKAGKKAGVQVLVEKQGANGIEGRHTKSQLRNASAVIFASDVAVKEEERYAHLPKVKTSVAAPLRDADTFIAQALKKAESYERNEPVEETMGEEDENRYSFKTEVKDSLLTGISYIIPIIVAGGMTLAAAVFIAQTFDLQALYDTEGSWLWMLRQLGGSLINTLMIPLLAGYMAYSIADKPALGPGLAAGVAANLIESGFLGGMLGGLLAGYLLKLMKHYIKPKGTFAGFISFWVYPVIGTLVTGSIMLFVVGSPLASLNNGLVNWLGTLSGTNALILGAVIGAMVSFDLGGPVNKAAYTFCIGAMASGNFIPYAAFASVKMVSAFAVTGATVVGKALYSKQEREVGKQTWLLGLAGITEGAIPFMIKDPIRVIPSLVAGSAVTGAIVAYFGIGLSVPGAGIFSLALLDGGNAFTAAAIWLGAAVVGAVISMFLLLAAKKRKVRQEAHAR
ncbi:PTS 2-O-a-mannosyl-D-glycerate transporter subunit IIABC [Shouchella shacheensis]|uniref:PTS 2-O-a-mannosyl-D-glycerate transporter subunit IIABC n=1 Tax=Shouchella shacheensis TaxID=1649580 RepID=UPI00073FB509|nr:PTS 2-O-a-mannosyl-D-glycerate transporter subunit IIABC [Shouchella shacheensis]